ncbi:GNAT family N-acetyltransferase [Brassicibacter mesophilus]|uniref:GNAT family N-acetyltransferase n=1 Tax=Brassicibacter mesophilus TaxID=745119 RepID=UPI003D2394DE
MEVVELKRKEINSLVRLWGKLSNYHKNFDDYIMPSSYWKEYMRDYFANDMDKQNKITFIAKNDNIYAGFIKAEIRTAPEIFGGSRSGYISELFIEEKYRGNGLALTLMEKAISWVKSKDADSIRLNVNSENLRAIRFYEKLGFKEVNKTLRLDI